MAGDKVNNLKEYIPEQFRQMRIDEIGDMTATEPFEGDAVRLKTITNNKLFVYDRLNENFTINCAGAYQYGFYKIHMETYPKIYRRSVIWELGQALDRSNDTWKYENGQIFEEHRKNWVFYLNVSYIPRLTNDPPRFAAPEEGGFKF